MSGNFLFIGIGLVQGNGGLLLRAIVAVLALLIGATCGLFYLRRVSQQPTGSRWLNTIARYLLLEWVVLLVFAIWWQFTGNLITPAETQITLLALAAFAMGIQGALVSAFSIPGVMANDLSGTLLLLGQRLAQWENRQVQENAKGWKSSKWFLALLCLLYILSAIVGTLTIPSIATPYVPVLIVTVTIVILLLSFSLQHRYRE
jgi:uncharacterized membrane protein YoaK (UPF0700 family)